MGWGRSHWRFRKIVRNRTFARSWSVYNCVRATADVDHRYAPFSGLEGSWGNWSPTSFHPYAPCLPRKIYHASFAIAHAQYTSYDVPRLFDDDIISIKKDYHDNCIAAVCVVCMRERAHNDSFCNLNLRITKIRSRYRWLAIFCIAMTATNLRVPRHETDPGVSRARCSLSHSLRRRTGLVYAWNAFG